MSNETKIPNEDELWDVLNTPTETPAKKAAAPAAEAPVPEKTEDPQEKAPKTARKIDGFFLGCMAGVAAVSVAVTLLVSSMAGGSGAAALPGATGGASGSDLDALRQENAQLKAQVELQQKTILDLQNNLMDFMGTEEFLENAATTPSGENEVLDKQTEAYEILVQIQNAYAEFDREKLEELIPEMDARLQYLSPEALNSYYLILEYMEQPGNG